jgi:hypothetical protein
MDHEEITDQTLKAFEDLLNEDEREPEVEEEVTTIPEEEDERDRDQEETPEEPEEDDEEEAGEDEGEGEPEEEEEGTGGEGEEIDAGRDIDVQAFLAKYGGDVEKALKGAADLYHLVNRQGQEKNAALARAEELEAQLQRLQAFSTSSIPLSEEQREWAEEAAGSGNPAGYVQMAVDAAEFDLARAVCEQWAREDPFNAGRIGQQIDAIEQQANAAAQQPVFELPKMLDAAREQFPDMPVYWGQMTRLIYQLGDDHHLVVAARSSDVHEAARGIVGLYDYAKATTVNVREAKDKVRADRRQAGVDERQRAQVTSATTSPAQAQTPRRNEIMPGLTLEDLEAEFARAE